VGVAADGNEAIHLVEALKPSLVVMDSALPVLDGIEAARKMLELSDKPKVVLMFGEDHAPDSRALGASAVAYVKKSSDLGSVMDVVVALAQVGVT
jgi:CheY-like chemotaxis protein